MSSEETTKYVKRAFEYKAASNYKQAIECLYKALELEPESSEILSEIAGLYCELNNPDKAIRYYEQALLYEPDNLQINYKLACVYKNNNFITKAVPIIRSICEKDFNIVYVAEFINCLYLQSDFEGVVSLYENEIVLNSTNAKVHYYAGSSYLALGNPKKARELYQKSLRYDSSNFDVVYSCAQLLSEEGSYDEASKLLIANPLTKTNHKAYYLLGEIMLAKNDINGAIDYYSKAIKLNSRNPLYYYSLATAYSVNGFMKEAENNYNNAVKLSPNNLFYAYTLALLYYQTKQIPQAKEKIKNILAVNENNINALILKSRILTDENNVVEAEQILKEVLRKEPKNFDALYVRADIFSKLSWWEKAIESINLAIKYCPDSIEFKSEAVKYYINANKFSDAEKLCKEIIKINNKYIFVYIKLAEIYVKQKRYSDALENIDVILDLEINTPSAYIMKAKIYFENKLYEQAIDIAKQAIVLDPDNIEYYKFVADTYFELREYKLSRSYYQEASQMDVMSVYYKHRAAKCAENLGDIEDAVVDYSRASRIAPNDFELGMDYCQCLYHNKEYNKALEVLHNLVKYADTDEKINKINKKTSKIKQTISKNLSGIKKIIFDIKNKNDIQN